MKGLTDKTTRVHEPVGSVQDALIRVRATVAALDDGLLIPIPEPPELLRILQERADPLPAIAALEREIEQLVYHATPLRTAASEERLAMINWGKRAHVAIEEHRTDLAQQASLRAEAHRRHAEAIETELAAFVALEAQYRHALLMVHDRPPSA